MAKRDTDAARLSTAVTHAVTAERNLRAADRAEARGHQRGAAKLRQSAEVAGKLSDNAANSIRKK